MCPLPLSAHHKCWCIQEIIKANNIVVFSSGSCPFCAMVQDAFASEGLDAFVVEADYATRVGLKTKTQQRWWDCHKESLCYRSTDPNLMLPRHCRSCHVEKIIRAHDIVCVCRRCSSVPQVCLALLTLVHTVFWGKHQINSMSSPLICTFSQVFE